MVVLSLPPFPLFSLANESRFMVLVWLKSSGSLCCSRNVEILQIREMKCSSRKELKRCETLCGPMLHTSMYVSGRRGMKYRNNPHSVLLPEARFLWVSKTVYPHTYRKKLTVSFFSPLPTPASLPPVHQRPELKFYFRMIQASSL